MKGISDKSGILLLILTAISCRTLPLPVHSPLPEELTVSDSYLAKEVIGLTADKPGLTGIYSLSDSQEAFSVRLFLAETAEKTLDLQYYIWHADTTGLLMFDAVQGAADRGVKVRILLDDLSTGSTESFLAALNLHPNIEIRLFNPFQYRTFRWIGYLTDFRRLNRRMHNKSFTADGRITVVGGRNIGDEYFGVTEDMLFLDLDAIAIGPVVADVSADFNRYWNSASSYSVRDLAGQGNPENLTYIKLHQKEFRADPKAAAYLKELKQSPFVNGFLSGDPPLEWAEARLISDHPLKALEEHDPHTYVFKQLIRNTGLPEKELDIVSAYFVPTEEGVRLLTALSAKGVKIRILTNSLEATDVPIVHSGYARWRKELLKAGIRIFELQRLSVSGEKRRKFAVFKSSGSSLHVKTFSADRRKIYIGSLNLDPRSVKLNTETGFLMDSPVLSQEMSLAFDTLVPEEAYEVSLDSDDNLIWSEKKGDQVVQHATEPGTNMFFRLVLKFVAFVNIDWLL